MKICSYCIFLAFLFKAISLDILYVLQELDDDLPSEGKYASLYSAILASSSKETLIVLEPRSSHTLKHEFLISNPLSITTNVSAAQDFDFQNGEPFAEISIISGSIIAKPDIDINIKICFNYLSLIVNIKNQMGFWIIVLGGTSMYLEVIHNYII